jgi:hypothetical protein
MRTHALVALVVLGCGPGSRPGGDSDAAGPTGDGAVCEDVIDVVFVLDTSSSMGFVLEQLEAQIAQVVAASNQLSPDAHFGLVVFQDNEWLDTTGPLADGKVHTAAATLQAAFRNYRLNYTANDRNPGDGPSGPTTQNPICEENSLDALHAAAAEFPWRANATRVVILATDDTFLEWPDNYGDRDADGDTTSTDFPREGNYPAARTFEETAAALRAGRVRVFSFSRLVPPSILFRCGTGRRYGWDHITDGWTSPYAGHAPFPDQTDGGTFDLALVETNQLSLAATINSIVLDSFCHPPEL